MSQKKRGFIFKCSTKSGYLKTILSHIILYLTFKFITFKNQKVLYRV